MHRTQRPARKPATRIVIHVACVLAAFSPAGLHGAESVLPTGPSPNPIDAPHFPDRLHTFIWRNWECADLADMARVLGTNEKNVREIGLAMGLPEHQPISELQRRHGYISVIRRNWHLLNYDQLLALLGWKAERLAETLKEDDFLWIKLGQLKPDCPPLRYEAPSEAVRKRCAEIKELVTREFGDAFNRPAQSRFAFIEELSRPLPGFKLPGVPDEDEPIRFLYSYFAVFGDPLLDAQLGSYPEGLLQRLSELGVKGVWLHVVLRDLAPCKDFPEFGKGHETRLANLRQLVQRAKKCGLKIYLYMNEPRWMPAAFFEKHPDIAGAGEGPGGANVAMCTSTETVRRFLIDSLAYVFREVPDLGGVFTITASENLTHCASHYNQASCPRCSKRSGAETIAAVNAAIAEGVRRGNPQATVICWDWGWKNAWAEEIIRLLPDNVCVMSVSEWDLPIERGGVKQTVGEYSMSGVGPGPRAQRHWKWAQQRGLKTVAKVQVNCTWELSALPCLPVMNLVARHMENLSKLGTRDMMLSWSLGGYPSPNLQLVREFSRTPAPTAAEALARVAEDRYGKAATPAVLKAWEAFSGAFEEYPYHSSGLYAGPFQLGPANLLYPTPTGYQATMVGFPYDDLNAWRGAYPTEVYLTQLRKVFTGWSTGMVSLQQAKRLAETSEARERLTAEIGLATAAMLHVQSAWCQSQFIFNRKDRPSEARNAAAVDRTLARMLFDLTRQDSRIGYEASNHYYYYPLDLVEKVINCQHILDTWPPQTATAPK